MKPSPEEILTRFASRLSCLYSCDRREPFSPSAATLPHFFSTSGAVGNRVCCTFPCMSLKGGRRRDQFLSDSTTIVSMEKEEAAERLGRILRLGRQSIALAPSMLLRNLLWSFGQTLEANLHKTICFMMEKQVSDLQASSHSSFDGLGGPSRSEEEQLKSDIASTALAAFTQANVSPITPVAAAINFCTILKTEDFQPHSYVWQDSTENAETDAPTGFMPDTDVPNYQESVAMPLTFEALIDVTIFGKRTVTARVVVPGTISGVFTTRRNHPDLVNVTLDTMALIKAMKRECREIVRQTVDIATGGRSWPRRSTSSLSAMDDFGSVPVARAWSETIPSSPDSMAKRSRHHSLDESGVLQTASPRSTSGSRHDTQETTKKKERSKHGSKQSRSVSMDSRYYHIFPSVDQ